MSNNIELLSQYDNFTIGTNSNLTEILANVVKVGTDTSNVTISIPQDISSSYNLILPVRQGASGESLVYGADGQLKWHDTTVLKQVVSVFGSTLTGNVVSTGIHDSPTYLANYTGNITAMAENSKIFVQFKVNYHAALSASNQISFYIKKTDTNGNTLATFSESLFGPYNAAGGFTGQYISNLVDEANTTNQISYQLGYQINGNVYATDKLGILGYEGSYHNTIVLQEFEGSGVYATSVWNKGADSNGLYYNDGTVHIGSTKDALDSQNTPGVALELSGNLVGTNANFSGNINAETFIGDLSGNVNAITMTATTTTTNNLSLDGTLTTSNSSRVEGNLIPSVDDTYSLGAPDRVWKDVYIGPGSLYLNGTKILDDSSDTINMRTDRDQALNIQTSGTGTLTLRSDTVTQINSGNTSSSPAQPGSIILNANGGSIKVQSDLVLEGTISMSQTGTTDVPINLNDDVDVAGDLDVGGNLKVNKINREDPLYTGLYLESVKVDGSEITGQLIGNVTGTVSSLSNLDTDDLTEGSTNKYYTTARVRADLSGGTGINYNENTGVFSLPQEVSSSSHVNFNTVTTGELQVTGTTAQIDNNLVVNKDLTVAGNITVNGTQTIVNSTVVEIGDNKIVLNAGGLSTNDAGIIANVNNSQYEFYFKTDDTAWYANEAIQSGTGFIGDVQGNLTSTGNVNLTNSAINITFTDYDNNNSVSNNNTFLIVGTNASDPKFEHKIVQEKVNNVGTDYDTYEIAPISDNGYHGGPDPRESFRIGGYNRRFKQAQIIAKDGLKVYTKSDGNDPQLKGNIECDTVNGNLTGNVVGDVTGNVVGNLVGDVTGDVTGNVSGVLTGSMTMTGHILPDTNGVYDIGSAEYKVRHMYLSSNSLWIGDEHKATINPSNNQLEFRRRKTDAIPQSFIAAGINDTSQILTAAGEASLSNMSLGKWKQVAKNLGITINGKTDLEIDPTDIFDTGESDDWQTTLDVKTIADDVSSLETLTTNQGTTLSAVEANANSANSLATTNEENINNINSVILNIQSDIYTAQGNISTAQTNISSLQTSVGNKQDTISSSTDLSIRDLTLTGCLRGPSTMYIDPATDGVPGTLIVNGDLQVKGTTTTIDSETLLIADNSIILNKDYTGTSPTEDASIEIERGTLQNAIIEWNESNDQWEFYKEGTGNLSNIKCNTIKVSDDATLGSVSATVSGTTLNVNGNANTSYGVCSLSGTITTINTFSTNSAIHKNTQIIVYYTNNSGSDLTINNTISGCKTNLSESLTVSNGSSVLFCVININGTYILTISQLY